MHSLKIITLFVVSCCILPVSCANKNDKLEKNEITITTVETKIQTEDKQKKIKVEVQKEDKQKNYDAKNLNDSIKTKTEAKNKINKTEGTQMQKTFGMIKPSGIDKADEIKNIIKMHGLKILDSKRVIMSDENFEKLYFMHKDRQFFNDLRSSLVGKEIEAMVIYGNNAIAKYREVVVKIRGKYAIDKTNNILHGTDDKDTEDENGRKLGGEKRAKEEICIFFKCEK